MKRSPGSRIRLGLMACVVGVVAPAAIAGVAVADEVFAPTAAISVGPNGISSFDISFVDGAIGIYVLADRTNQAVDVVDTGTNSLVKQLGAGTFVGFTGNNDTSGPNGALITANHREVWAGDGPGTGTSTVKVFDLQTGALTHTINTNGERRADELCEDPRNHVIQIANDAEADVAGHFPYVSFISTESYTVLGTIVMDGGTGKGHGPLATNGIEQCQWNPHNGKIYLNLPEVNGPSRSITMIVPAPKA
jgi:hypothetical protein